MSWIIFFYDGIFVKLTFNNNKKKKKNNNRLNLKSDFSTVENCEDYLISSCKVKSQNLWVEKKVQSLSESKTEYRWNF